ncbi:two component system response regulator [Providencia rettgeri]|uniref:Two component system response regulator n=2 Tax=Providencia TaxID=586 RepID=A0AA42FRL2_9GAMM|nr:MULTISPECIES: two component system response regulator [Providencia]MBC8654964.1 two component system response regulator [Providencia vermicola]EIU7557810.1 two component system response regulator [Providencia rettgeri]EIU9514135.1 two component system response regulator [Providencia rettgeri]EJD6367541.1 two component system response regulator [Providencia rettgeri]EJD6375082.1 two component system response regulator [Providencia rettgeri]
MKKKVLLVEDHELLSAGIKHFLSYLPEYEVIGVVCNGLQVYETCQKLNPDLVILDLGLPGMDGIDVICRLKQRWHDLNIIVLTADREEHRACSALNAGAMGYVLKNSSQQTLLSALQSVVFMNRVFIDPSLSEAQIFELTQTKEPVRLTTRERQILKLISEERRNRDIAEDLKITIKTVETHRLNLMRKLGTHSSVGLVKWAYRLGIC